MAIRQGSSAGNDMGLRLLSLVGPILRANSYLLFEAGRAVLIDPFWNREMEQTISVYADAVDYILLTHEHYDHVCGAAAARERYSCPVVASERCANILRQPSQRMLRHFEAFCRLQRFEDRPKSDIDLTYCCSTDVTFAAELELEWQGHTFYFRSVPGHSPGSSCILVDETYLFSGDSLLPGQERPSIFPGGSIEAFEKQAVPYFCSLPRDTKVCPGHFETFNLSEHPSITLFGEGV